MAEDFKLEIRVNPGVVIDGSTTPADLPKPTQPPVRAVSTEPSGWCAEEFELGTQGRMLDRFDSNARPSGGRCVGGKVVDRVHFLESKNGQVKVVSSRGKLESAEVAPRPGQAGQTKTAQYHDDGTVDWKISGPANPDDFPARAKRLPVIPGIGRLKGTEKISDLFTNATELHPETNADAQAWKEKLGDPRQSILGLDPHAPEFNGWETHSTFFDTNDDGLVDAYRVKVDVTGELGVGVFDLVDVVKSGQADGAWFRLLQPFGSDLAVFRAKPDSQTGLLSNLSPLKGDLNPEIYWATANDEGKLMYGEPMRDGKGQVVYTSSRSGGTIVVETTEKRPSEAGD